MLGSVGLPELLLILLIALLLFGGKKLPEVARSMGQALRAFKEEASKLRGEVEVELQNEERKKGIQAEEKSVTSVAK